MSKQDLTNEIEKTSPKDVRIAPELAEIIVHFCQNNIVPNGSAMKTKQLVNRCPQASYSRLKRLEDLGFLSGFKKDADTHIIHAPSGEFLDRHTFRKTLKSEIGKLKTHIQKDSQIRSIAANELNVSRAQVVNELTQGTVWDQRNKLVSVIDAIESTSSVTKGPYGRIIIRNSPKFWQATKKSITIYNK